MDTSMEDGNISAMETNGETKLYISIDPKHLERSKFTVGGDKDLLFTPGIVPSASKYDCNRMIAVADRLHITVDVIKKRLPSRKVERKVKNGLIPAKTKVISFDLDKEYDSLAQEHLLKEGSKTQKSTSQTVRTPEVPISRSPTFENSASGVIKFVTRARTVLIPKVRISIDPISDDVIKRFSTMPCRPKTNANPFYESLYDNCKNRADLMTTMKPPPLLCSLSFFDEVPNNLTNKMKLKSIGRKPAKQKINNAKNESTSMRKKSDLPISKTVKPQTPLYPRKTHFDEVPNNLTNDLPKQMKQSSTKRKRNDERNDSTSMRKKSDPPISVAVEPQSPLCPLKTHFDGVPNNLTNDLPKQMKQSSTKRKRNDERNDSTSMRKMSDPPNVAPISMAVEPQPPLCPLKTYFDGVPSNLAKYLAKQMKQNSMKQKTKKERNESTSMRKKSDPSISKPPRPLKTYSEEVPNNSANDLAKQMKQKTNKRRNESTLMKKLELSDSDSDSMTVVEAQPPLSPPETQPDNVPNDLAKHMKQRTDDERNESTSNNRDLPIDGDDEDILDIGMGLDYDELL